MCAEIQQLLQDLGMKKAIYNPVNYDPDELFTAGIMDMVL